MQNSLLVVLFSQVYSLVHMAVVAQLNLIRLGHLLTGTLELYLICELTESELLLDIVNHIIGVRSKDMCDPVIV